MPIAQQPKRVPDVNPEDKPFVFTPDQIADAMALSIVNKTFSQYETYRTNNHDRRWNDADALYIGWVPQKVWEGTTIPRSNLPYQIVFDQVNSAKPSIMQALFSDQDWFDVQSEIGTSVEEAKEVQAAMRYFLEHAKNDYGLNAISEIGMAIDDVLKYSNGGVWIDWDGRRNRPIVSWVDIRDIYIDPACPTPSIDENRSVIRRRLMTVDEISQFRGDPRMKVPEDGELWYMAQSAPTAPADYTRQSQEALRTVNYSPQQQNYIANPADMKIEVLMYYSANQIIWVLNRQHVLFNIKNPYGFIPGAFAVCYPVNGRFYGQGIPDVQRGNQRMIEGILNGHLDEISLALHPPRVSSRADNITNNQRRWGPGSVFTTASEDPKNALSLLQPQPATTAVMQEVSFLLEAADKRTGIGAMAQGMPRPGNANRTATGMSIQAEGAANRIQPIVKNIEDYMLVPLLRKMYKMIAHHIGAYDKVPGVVEGEVKWIQGFKFQRPCEFIMNASSRMMARATLMQVFPFVTQYLLNGPFIESLKAAGQTVNFQALLDMLQDAAGTKGRYELIRQMTPEEQQKAQQPPPNVIAQQQMEQAKLQQEEKLTGMKIQGDLQKAMISKQSSPEEMQMKMAESQQKMQIEQFKAEMDAAMQKQKLDFERQMGQLKLQLEQAKAGIQLQTQQAKAQSDQAIAQQKMETQQQQSAMDLQTAMMGNQQQLRHTEESHQMALRQQKEMGAAKSAGGGSEGSNPRKKAEVKSRRPTPK